MEYYWVIKRKEILPSATTWMDLENVMLSEINQLVNEKYHMIKLIYKFNEHNKLRNKIETEA